MECSGWSNVKEKIHEFQVYNNLPNRQTKSANILAWTYVFVEFTDKNREISSVTCQKLGGMKMAGSFSIPGVASGMDWGSMVDEIIAKSQKAYEPMLTKKDNLEKKITLYEEMNQSIRALQNKVTALKLPSLYKAKAAETARLDSNGLASAVLTANVTSEASVMNYEIEVLQKAMTMTRYGKKLTGTSVDKDSVFYMNVGGKRAKINVSKSDTLETIAKKINNARDMTSPTVPLDVTAMVVDGQLVVRSTKTGAGSDGKLSQTLERDKLGYDKINFYPDLKNDLINGAVSIKGKDASGADKTFVLGLDFDIVGNEIRWRDFNPKAATAGSSYSLVYNTAPSDRLNYSITRGAEGFDSVFSTDTFKVDADGNVVMPGNFAISWNGNSYTKGVDYKIEKDGIKWLGANKPPEGAQYSVRYGPAAGETWLMPAVKREDSDVPPQGTLVSTSASGVVTTDPNANPPTYADYRKNGGSAVITQGNKKWIEGVDFEIVTDGTTAGNMKVKWNAGATAPEAGSSYELKLSYTSVSGIDKTKHEFTSNVIRSDEDQFSFDSDYLPFEGAGPAGTFDTKIIADNGYEYAADWAASGSPMDAWTGSINIKWTPSAGAGTPRDVPKPAASNSKYTVEYTGNMNMFSFDDTDDGILETLGLKGYSDPKDVNGQDAKVRVNDGPVKTFSTNNIVFTKDDTIFNELGETVSLLGLSLNVKGPGKVQIDVTQDAEKAVTGLQEYVTAYNELLDWINKKLEEKSVDESIKDDMKSDDFRMRWGLLHGDQLLTETKNKLRMLSSVSQPLGFQSRTGRTVMYGTFGDAGLQKDGNFTIRLGGEKATISIELVHPNGTKEMEDAAIGGFVVPITISPDDTLESATKKINDALQYQYTSREKLVPVYVIDPKTGKQSISGYKTRDQITQTIPMGKAEVKNGRIVLTSAFNETGKEIPLMVQDSSGVLKYLGLNDKYTMISQVGLSTGVSKGEIGTNAKSGFLEFDTDKFMKAMTEDADAVADLMVTNMKEMDKYLTSLASQAQKEFAPGVVGYQGKVAGRIDQMRQEITSINKYLADADRRLEDKADALYRKFSAAEKSLALLSQQAASMSSALALLTSGKSTPAS